MALKDLFSNPTSSSGAYKGGGLGDLFSGKPMAVPKATPAPATPAKISFSPQQQKYRDVFVQADPNQRKYLADRWAKMAQAGDQKAAASLAAVQDIISAPQKNPIRPQQTIVDKAASLVRPVLQAQSKALDYSPIGLPNTLVKAGLTKINPTLGNLVPSFSDQQKALLRAPIQGAVRLGVQAQGQPAYQPTGAANQLLLGKGPVKNLEGYGRETAGIVPGLDKKVSPTLATALGAGMTALDLSPVAGPGLKGALKGAKAVGTDLKAGAPLLKNDKGFLTVNGPLHDNKVREGLTVTSKDGKTRTIHSDEGAKVQSKGISELEQTGETSLAKVLKQSNYDKNFGKDMMKNITVKIDDSIPSEALSKVKPDGTGTIHLTSDEFQNLKSGNPSTLLHEREHFGQAKEGRAVGATPKEIETSPKLKELDGEYREVLKDVRANKDAYTSRRNQIMHDLLGKYPTDKAKGKALRDLQDEFSYHPAHEKLPALRKAIDAESAKLDGARQKEIAKYYNSLGEAEARFVERSGKLSQKELDARVRSGEIDGNFGIHPDDLHVEQGHGNMAKVSDEDIKKAVASQDAKKLINATDKQLVKISEDDPELVSEVSRLKSEAKAKPKTEMQSTGQELGKTRAYVNRETDPAKKAELQTKAKELDKKYAQLKTDAKLDEQKSAPKATSLKEGLKTSEPTHGLKPGQLVKAADRDNVGKVTGVNGDQVRVHFKNKQDGSSATKTFKSKDLSPIGPGVKVNDEGLPVYDVKHESKLNKAIRSTRDVIARQGEHGQKLASMLDDSRKVNEVDIQAKSLREMPSLQKLSGKERADFADVVEGHTKGTDKQQAAAKEWKTVAKQIRDRAVAAGLDVGDLGPDYFPHNIDWKVLNKKDRFNEAVNHLVKTGQAADQAEAVGLLKYAQDIARNREFGNLEASRLVDLPFYDKSATAISDYLAGAGRRISNAETFGAGDEAALKLIAAIGNDGKDMDAAKRAFDIAIGAQKYDTPGRLSHSTSGKLRNYMATTKLGLSAITNSTQNVNTAIVTGYHNMVKGFGGQFTKEGKDFISKTGTTVDSVLNDIRDERGFGRSILAKVGAPFFNTVERSNRGVAALAGRHWANDLASKGDAKSLAILRDKLGVKGEVGKTLTEGQQIQAARKLVEISQFKTSAMDLPGWASSPEGKLVAQFRTFSYKQGGFVKSEILNPLRKGNMVPLMRLMAALPIGYGVYSLKNELRDRPNESDPERLALEIWGNVGGGGLPVDVVRGLWPTNAKYLPTGTAAAQVSGVFGGPAISTAAKAVDALYGTFIDGSKSNPNKKYEKAERFGLQQIPLVGSTLSNGLLPYNPKDGKAHPPSMLQAALSTLLGSGSASAGSGLTPAQFKDKQGKGTPAKNELTQDEQDFLKLSKAQRDQYLKENPDMKYLAKASDKEKELKREQEGQKLDLPANLDDESKKVLINYDRLSAEGKAKFKDNPDNAFNLKSAQLEEKVAKGEVSGPQEFSLRTSLQKAATTKDYSQDVKDFYSMSKDQQNAYVAAHPDEGKQLYAQAYQLDQSLLRSGQIKTAKYKYGLGTKPKKGRTVKYPKVHPKKVSLPSSHKISLGKPKHYSLKSALAKSK